MKHWLALALMAVPVSADWTDSGYVLREPWNPPGYVLDEPTRVEFMPLMTNGPPENRLNVVFLPEAYRNSERDQFVADVALLRESLFEFEPFLTYKNYFNTAAIWVTFAGADTSYRNYFCGESSSFDRGCGGSDGRPVRNIYRRFLPTNKTIAVILAYDGGSFAGSLSMGVPEIVVSCQTLHDGNSRNWTPDQVYTDLRGTLVHEFGHVLGELGEEYESVRSGKYIPSEDGIERPNVTEETNRDRLRWRSWINSRTPIPTPENNSYSNVVGLFQGAGNLSNWYRPRLTCMMRDARSPFCEICREILTRNLYGVIGPIDSVSTRVGDASTVFRASLQQPSPNTLRVRWLIDGAEVPGERGEMFNVAETAMSFGRHTITIQIQDTTAFVRDDPRGWLARTYEWPVVNTPSPDFNNDGRVSFEDFFLFGDAFGLIVAEHPEAAAFDLDMDGEVGFGDFFLFADEFVG